MKKEEKKVGDLEDGMKKLEEFLEETHYQAPSGHEFTEEAEVAENEDE